MSPDYLRALQARILTSSELAALAITPDMGKVDGGAYQADKQIAQALRAGRWFGPGEPTSRSVLASEARNVLLSRGKWRAIVRKAAEDGGTPVDEAAWTAVELAKSDSARIDLLLPEVQLMLDALQAGDLIDAPVRAELEALCATDPGVTAEHVSRALRGPWGDE